MARRPIHPGDHLAEELNALGMSAAELGRQLKVPTNRVTRDPEWTARHHRRHGPTSRPFLRHHRAVLAEPAEPLRAAPSRTESGEGHQGLAHA